MKRNVLRVCVLVRLIPAACGDMKPPTPRFMTAVCWFPKLWSDPWSLYEESQRQHKAVTHNCHQSRTCDSKSHTYIFKKNLKGASSSDFGSISLGSEMFWQWLQILYITAARRHSLLFQSDLFKLIFFKMQSVSITIKRCKYFATTQIQVGFIRFSSFKLLF